MAFQKCQIGSFNNILISTSAPCQQIGHIVCHVCIFCLWIDCKDQNKIDFLISRIDLEAKSVYGPYREMAQNVEIKNAFTPSIK